MITRAAGVALVCAAALVTAVAVDAVAPSYGGTGSPTCLGRVVTLAGSSGPDHLGTEPGTEVIAGGDGNDVVIGDDPNTRGSADYVCGGRGDDELNGYVGPDSLSGGEGNDELSGGRGSDVLEGGTGNDVLQGGQFGSGDGVVDRLDGGPGHDVCRVEAVDTFTRCEDVLVIERPAARR